MYTAKQLIKISLLFMAILMTPVSAFAAQVVDINRADAATMIENWKGIGEKKAKAIISYRKSNGPFASIDDLANVKGIGEGIIKNNRKLMSVSKGVVKATGKKQSSNKETTTKSVSKDKKKEKKSTDSSSAKKSSSKKSDSKKSTDKKSTKKKSTAKKPASKSSKKKKCKKGSKDKDCAAPKSKKKNSTT